MLRGNNDSKLVDMHVPEICVPFYQVWQELVDGRTLDVYQYRVLTSLSGLKELESVIVKTLSGLFNSDANMEACREEMLYGLDRDAILDRHYKPILNRLRASLGEKPKVIADKNRLLHQIRYATKEIESTYLKFALSDLKSSILTKDIGKIEDYANTVASQAIYNGWSPQGLFDLLRFFRHEKNFDEQWENFSKILLDSTTVEHQVLINVPFRGKSTAEQEKTLFALNQLDLNVKTYEQITACFATITDIGHLIKSEKRYFLIEVKAKDIYAAAHAAITKISEKLNLASFYNLVNAWDLKSVVIVTINTQNNYHRSFTAEALYETHDYIDSSSRVFDGTRQIFIDKDKQAIRDKLQGSFGYTNISRASLFQEEKYMNLWVALESLARTDMQSNIISNVRETVPAATSLRYIYRIVRNFVEDCRRCGILFAFSTQTIDMEQESKQKMVKETIAMLQDSTLFSELQEKCKVNTLLSYRANDILKLISEIPFAKNKIENHYKRVNWQIQRLYRIRNEIAHAALQEHASLLMYIEHLYDYLSTYISEIVNYLVEKEYSTIEDALCAIKGNYDVFIAFCNSSDKLLIKEEVLKTGIIDLISISE